MPVQWYLNESGEPVGPISESELKRMVEDGRLQPSSLVKRAGTSKWIPVSRIRGLSHPPMPASSSSAATSHASAVNGPAKKVPDKEHKSSRTTRWLLTAVVALPLCFVGFCCLPLIILSMHHEAETQKALDAANQLWETDRGKAAVNYRQLLEAGRISNDDRERVYKRVIEYDVSIGNLSEATALLRTARQRGVKLTFTDATCISLLSKVDLSLAAEKQSELGAQRKKRLSELIDATAVLQEYRDNQYKANQLYGKGRITVRGQATNFFASAIHLDGSLICHDLTDAELASVSKNQEVVIEGRVTLGNSGGVWLGECKIQKEDMVLIRQEYEAVESKINEERIRQEKAQVVEQDNAQQEDYLRKDRIVAEYHYREVWEVIRPLLDDLGRESRNQVQAEYGAQWENWIDRRAAVVTAARKGGRIVAIYGGGDRPRIEGDLPLPDAQSLLSAFREKRPAPTLPDDTTKAADDREPPPAEDTGRHFRSM